VANIILKFNESGQCKGPFAKLLESRAIYAQYTMPGTPQQNESLSSPFKR